MKINLAENIRFFRKSRNLTQERLAEIMGVSVAAVSKWESGQSTPELNLIVEMAAFFETSVDVLLGYSLHKGSAEDAAAEIKQLRLASNYRDGTKAAESALKKYPNHFQVAYQSALLYYSMMDPAGALRALELLKRSCELIDQNTDESVGVVSIQNRMAELHLFVLNQQEEGIELLKKNNFAGLNNSMIGYTLSLDGQKSDEALFYLTEALYDCELSLFRICIGYSNAYGQKGMHKDALEVLLLLLQIHAGLKKPDMVTCLDKSDVNILVACAKLAYKIGRPDQAREYLRQGLLTARKFDAAPDYTAKGLRFFHGQQGTMRHDIFGDNMEAYIAAALNEDEEGMALQPVWEELIRETDKTNQK